jgi:hypothetical protein
MHRHGIKHFVGQNQAAEALGQAIQPDHARQQMRGFRRKQRALPRLQVGADFQDADSASAGRVGQFQFAQQIQPPAGRCRRQARGCRQSVARSTASALRASVRPNNGVNLGRRDEIARCTELGGTTGVITQARRVQRQFHVTRERYPAAGPCDVGLNMGTHPPAMNQGIRVRRRKLWRGSW